MRNCILGRQAVGWVRHFESGTAGLGSGVPSLSAPSARGCSTSRRFTGSVADAIAPGIALAQVIGRLGNWFNQELFGSPTTLPWALEIDVAHRPVGYEAFATFQPTFLYEALWMTGVVLVLIWADKRFHLGHGRVFALYVALYCAGRLWIEALRIDAANTVLGLRLNIWTALLVGIGALVYLVVAARLRPGREDLELAAGAEKASGTV